MTVHNYWIIIEQMFDKERVIMKFMFKNVYKNCPEFENDRYLLRLVNTKDTDDLLKVYSDKKAVYFFNSDNCGGDDFYYVTKERMSEAVEYWLWEYSRKGFVRWSVVDKFTDEAIGTIELFHRKSNDNFNKCGLLRLDLRSDYEYEAAIINILSLIIKPTYRMFNCRMIATKAIPSAKNRISALKATGFSLSDAVLVGHDGTEYKDYYVIKKRWFNL